MKRLTNTEFKNKFYQLFSDKEYTLVTEYINSRTKIKVKHHVCQHIYSANPRDLIGKYSRCPFCKRSKKWTDQDWKTYVENGTNFEYQCIDPYINNGTKIRIKHMNCGTIYFTSPNNFISGHRCAKCYGKTKRTNQEWQTLVINTKEYTPIDHYINTNTSVKIKHNTCGRTFNVIPYNFIKGSRCPFCSKNHKKSPSEWEALMSQYKDEYQLLTDYSQVHSNTKVEMLHLKCGKVFTTKMNYFLSGGYRCPHCASSKGEKSITKFLTQNNICFIPQYTFPDCKDKRVLPFDFAIFDIKGRLIYLIEFDGVFHEKQFNNSEYSYNQLKQTQKHDQIKNNYCIQHNIKLIRIKYTENLQERLDEIFGKNIL